MKVAITWRGFLSGLKLFIPGWKAEKPHVTAAKFQLGLKVSLSRRIDGIFNETNGGNGKVVL